MRKYVFIFTLCSFLFVFLTPVTSFGAPENTNNEVKLTEEQQKEISVLQKELLTKKKEIITKYMEYGVISEKQGKEMLAHIERHYEKKKEHNFMPPKHRKHCEHDKKGS
ncbi:YckD family protein [Priestia endophytica]|uniref:DUF2680 domain-containing protein n=1 Tax=Priestia endophytica TaxID=135735 RepID=A0AAX1Q7G0_9BACI|nr:YckD family protein [Priestia endophytica]MCM3538546.1 YckD family protein [Priestia endophytica]RAS76387.1 hypothetical protein A3864_13330 [Priestia endophytica]RAS91616.1 hypothetical protein A3863_05245 [Priestia endophytica]